MAQTLSRITRCLLGTGSLWALLDSCLGLENVWPLFIHRTLAPVFLVTACVVSVIGLVWRRYTGRYLSPLDRALQALILAACVAPVIRSIVVMSKLPTLPATAGATEIRLLDFNVLGHVDLSSNLLGEIKRLNPDVVTLQEVNYELAQTLQSTLIDTYPCQIMEPSPGSWGMGLLSKYPCTRVTPSVPGHWVGTPLVATLNTGAPRPLAVVSIHAIHPHAFFRPNPRGNERFGLSETIGVRETSFKNLISQLSGLDVSGSIIAGDINATMRSNVYEQIRAAGYVDSWLQLHSLTSGGTWPRLESMLLAPISWLLRIDFVFHSPSLKTTSIERLPPTVGSDHRGLFVTLR